MKYLSVHHGRRKTSEMSCWRGMKLSADSEIMGICFNHFLMSAERELTVLFCHRMEKHEGDGKLVWIFFMANFYQKELLRACESLKDVC